MPESSNTEAEVINLSEELVLLKARTKAALRMLLDSGDITPMGVRMIEKILEDDRW